MQVAVRVEAPVSKCYQIWSDRLNWLQWFDMIEEVRCRKAGGDVEGGDKGRRGAGNWDRDWGWAAKVGRVPQVAAMLLGKGRGKNMVPSSYRDHLGV